MYLNLENISEGVEKDNGVYVDNLELNSDLSLANK